MVFTTGIQESGIVWHQASQAVTVRQGTREPKKCRACLFKESQCKKKTNKKTNKTSFMFIRATFGSRTSYCARCCINTVTSHLVILLNVVSLLIN